MGFPASRDVFLSWGAVSASVQGCCRMVYSCVAGTLGVQSKLTRGGECTTRLWSLVFKKKKHGVKNGTLRSSSFAGTFTAREHQASLAQEKFAEEHSVTGTFPQKCSSWCVRCVSSVWWHDYERSLAFWGVWRTWTVVSWWYLCRAFICWFFFF